MQHLLPPSCPLIFPSFMETGQDKRRWKREGATTQSEENMDFLYQNLSPFSFLCSLPLPDVTLLKKPASQPASTQTHHTHAHSSPVRCQWLWLGVLTLLSEFRSPSLVWNSHRPHLPTNSKTCMYMCTCVYGHQSGQRHRQSKI